MAALGVNGVLQVIPPALLEAQLQQKQQAQTQQQAQPAEDLSGLVGYIKTRFEIFRNHRNTQSGWSERMLESARAFNGQYSPSKIQEVKKFGGSEIYARVIAQKCRAASSLLRDIYLGQDQPWALKPPTSPPLPPDVLANIDQMIKLEGQQVQQQLGKPPSPEDLYTRREAILQSAMDAAKKKATQQAKVAEDKIEQLLRDGGFYHALAEFLIDLPVFPFACIKGPIVKVVPTVVWPPGGGKPIVQQKPKLTWVRVSPFDLWWTPGVADIENADVIEKSNVTRAELNDLLDLPGYNHDEIMAVLDEYGRGGLYDNWDTTDAERSIIENRENPAWNRSGLISMMEFNGNVQGRTLQDYGMAVPDEMRDYHIQAWAIGRHVIKVQQSPSPRLRHPYFITSFEKTPGSPLGNGLSDLLSDVQEAANATLRSLVNNMSIASGPQVVVNETRLAAGENGEDLYAWKRWKVRDDPFKPNGDDPIKFFMPQMNAQELMQTYNSFITIADDVSAIPKYVGGSGGGGAGRTASGLAMLMGNASKILQSVSANIDRDVMEPALLQLQDLILLTDTTGLLTGEEKISVLGVNVAIQRETLRQRQLEFLQATANPIDMDIIGEKGRGVVLRNVSQGLGLPGEDIVPSDMQLEQKAQQKAQQGSQQTLDQKVQEGVAQGVKQGVQRIATELVAGELAAHAQMPEGMPTHLGTLPGSGAQPGPDGGMPSQGSTSNPSMIAKAGQAQGNQPSPSSNSMGPQTNVVGPPKGPGAHQITGGVG